jgi:hypothetical protein
MTSKNCLSGWQEERDGEHNPGVIVGAGAAVGFAARTNDSSEDTWFGCHRDVHETFGFRVASCAYTGTRRGRLASAPRRRLVSPQVLGNPTALELNA